MASFYKWLQDYVKEENYWVKDLWGISYYFCEDSILDEFINITDIDIQAYSIQRTYRKEQD